MNVNFNSFDCYRLLGSGSIPRGSILRITDVDASLLTIDGVKYQLCSILSDMGSVVLFPVYLDIRCYDGITINVKIVTLRTYVYRWLNMDRN